MNTTTEAITESQQSAADDWKGAHLIKVPRAPRKNPHPKKAVATHRNVKLRRAKVRTLAMRGLTAKQIAAELKTTEATVTRDLQVTNVRLRDVRKGSAK